MPQLVSPESPIALTAEPQVDLLMVRRTVNKLLKAQSIASMTVPLAMTAPDSRSTLSIWQLALSFLTRGVKPQTQKRMVDSSSALLPTSSRATLSSSEAHSATSSIRESMQVEDRFGMPTSVTQLLEWVYGPTASTRSH